MKYLKLLYRIPGFLLFYLVKLVEANFQIAWIIISPGAQSSPGFLEVPLSIKNRAGMFIFSNLISMTPGTLSVAIDDNQNVILVHALVLKDHDNVLNEMKDLQARVNKLFE